MRDHTAVRRNEKPEFPLPGKSPVYLTDGDLKMKLIVEHKDHPDQVLTRDDIDKALELLRRGIFKTIE